MKKLRLTRLLAVILAVIMVLPLFAACNKNRKYDNEKDQLVVGLEEPDGVFNSFFATSGNDTTVAGTVAASLISMDKNAKIVCGPEYPSVALDFMQKVTYDPSNPNATEVIDGVTYTDYYFVLKNKVKYSDGTPLTIKDVLFTYYVYLDTSYIGSSTMYSTDIIGLQAYRTQTDDENAQENLDYQMLQSAVSRRNSLVEAYKDIKKNEYNDNLVAANLRDELSYTVDDDGVRHYTLKSTMRDKIREEKSIPLRKVPKPKWAWIWLPTMNMLPRPSMRNWRRITATTWAPGIQTTFATSYSTTRRCSSMPRASLLTS